MFDKKLKQVVDNMKNSMESKLNTVEKKITDESKYSKQNAEKVDKQIRETESRLAKINEIVLNISKKSTNVNQDLTPNGGATKKIFDDKSVDEIDIEESIIKACKRDAKKIHDQRKSCELSMKDQKCDFCDFATHSKGLLKLHEKEAHEKKLSFQT